MAELKIDLSSFPERFATNSKELIISKRVNFVFGKNGTGKTTITDAIKNQLSSQYNVCVFKDFENIVGENRRLDAIALGKENTEIQKQIDEIEKNIAEIKKEIEKTENKPENLFTKAEKLKKEHEEQNRRIDSFYTQSAQKIKNISTPQIAKTSYDKNGFKNEIGNAKLLSDDEIKKHKATIKAEQKATIIKIPFPVIVLSEFLKSTNEILQSKVTQQQIITELQNSTDKQNFAKEGLRIHKHEKGEKCAFCGNEISDDRWARLGSYFNDEVKKFESCIDNEMSKIVKELSNLENITNINTTEFYDNFAEQIKLLNSQIKNTKNDYKTFFNSLKTALEDKKKNLFTVSNELQLSIPKGFNEIKNEYEKIADESNEFSKNLTKEQENAKKALRCDEVKKALDAFKYDTENANLEILKKQKDEAQKALSDKKVELEQKIAAKNELVLQTKDEKKISQQINKLLKNMGVASFSLELVNDTAENQKGQYQIKGYNDKIRAITDLSKGEKNIIAFLYFLFSLEKVDDDNKPKIILFDDPMTSNDDTMQYLMTEEIRNYYSKVNSSDDYFLLLTHNLHFYINVRPYLNPAEESGILKRNKTNTKKEKSYYEKNGYFELKNNGTHTEIRSIATKNDDHSSSYEALWNDLLFLYENDKPISMLNNCRRIIETYTKFNGIENKFYTNSEFVKKLFNVNSHSIDGYENELNGKTKDEIKQMMYELFKQNGAKEHYMAYFPLSDMGEDNDKNVHKNGTKIE
ncbi:MAG: hypothetical protein Ta2B_14540 [Termitinemataceae bacterium]|nr:MAG: hypothetical protein Ta2B_14540 [Termitinemataceae bacterium]